MKKKIPLIVLAIILSFFMYKGLYAFNLIKYPNVLVQGELVELDTNNQVKNIKKLINVKFHLKENLVKKQKSEFVFYNAIVPILKIQIVQEGNSDLYHYHLDKEYVNQERVADSYMKLFCEDEICGLTFAFIDNETKINILQNTTEIKLDGMSIPFKKIRYDYKKNKIDNTELKNIKYEFNENKVKICTKFSNDIYTETLRVTTVDYKNEAIQKVCTKEDTEGSCCEINKPTKDYKGINVLHWKGSWNEGYFREYSIQLKEENYEK